MTEATLMNLPGSDNVRPGVGSARCGRVARGRASRGLVLRAGALLVGLLVAAGCRADEPGAALEVGAAAPTLSATAHDGTEVTVGQAGGPPTVVYFYPKDGTPGCTREACAFRDVWNRYTEAGIRVVGVSADDADSHRQFAAEHNLPFPLISDEDFTWANAFGVPRRLGMHARHTFLVAPDGTIAQIYRDVDPGTHADEVLADAAVLTAAGAPSEPAAPTE